jgi:hypothetical protein
MEVTPENITARLLYNVVYEYLRKCGLDDDTAVELALSFQGQIGFAAEQAGGDSGLVPEE